MERQEHTNLIQSILSMVNSEHQAEASETLTRLSEDYESVLNDINTLTEKNNSLAETNSKLKSANADLFLKVTSDKPIIEEKQAEDKKEDIPTFESLFNEKGELK